MADDESTSGLVPGLMQEFIAQLHGVTERLEGLTRVASASLPSVPALPSLPDLRSLPMPGALSAAQLRTLAATVAAQRRSIEALKSQLTAFDEQLVVLERIIGPLAEWSGTWAEIEDRLINIGRGQKTEDQAEDS